MCLSPKKISGFMGLLENGLVTMFMGLFMVWFGFLDLFLIFLDFMERIWLLDLDLDLGFARD